MVVVTVSHQPCIMLVIVETTILTSAVSVVLCPSAHVCLFVTTQKATLLASYPTNDSRHSFITCLNVKTCNPMNAMTGKESK